MAVGDITSTKNGMVRETADGKFETLGLERISGLVTPTDISVVIANAGTTNETAVGVTGLITVISCLSPDVGQTYTIQVIDENDIPVFEATAQVDNVRTISNTQLQVVATDKIKITADGVTSEEETYLIQIR